MGYINVREVKNEIFLFQAANSRDGVVNVNAKI
jgi:hypothetical protein